MKFPKARKFFGGMRKRIYGIFGRNIGDTASKSKQPNTKEPIGHHHPFPMELEGESTTAITMDLPRCHRKLPAELNREIYLCFNPGTQSKFIAGLGWDFYAMFRYRLLTKTKRVCNPRGNLWNGTNMTATIAADHLNVRIQVVHTNFFAEQPFPISGPLCRMDDFPGTILYYYEVMSHLYVWSYVGLSGGAIPVRDNSWIGRFSNSYAIPNGYFYGCWLAGEVHQFELPEGSICLKRNRDINVFGCGLVLDSEDKLAIFFTFNGQLLGRKIRISPTVDRLFPAVTMGWKDSFEANFGDDPTKPFEYDIQNCPGLGLACI